MTKTEPAADGFLHPQSENHAYMIPPASGLRSESVLVALLILVVLLCYGNTLANGFVYDDQQQILQNPYIRNWHFLPQIFGTTVWSFVGQAGTTNYYRPLMTFSYLFLWQIFGPLPTGFHLFNVVMHMAVVVMVFFVGRRLFLDYRVAWIAALLFAIHPVHTEAVTWIAALPDLLATFFFLLTMGLLLLAEPGRWDLKYTLGALVGFSFALLSKEPSLMLAPLVVVFEHGLEPQRHDRTLIAKLSRYAPFFVLGLGYLLLRVALFGKIAPVLQRPSLTWPQAIYSSFALCLDYTKLLLWPVHLSAFHVFRASHSVSEPRVLGGIGIVLVAIAGVLFLWKKAPPAAFAVMWIGVTLAPVLNARWMAGNVFTERYLYLPSVGFCWLIAWLGIRWWDGAQHLSPWARCLRLTLAALLAAGVLLGSAKTISRNRDWRDDLTLYTRTLESDPDAHIIRGNLAVVYLDQGDLGRAEREWKTTLAGKPDSVNSMDALGVLYTQEGRYAEAEAMFKRAIVTKPLWGTPHYNYGALLQKTGDLRRALDELKTGVELSPLSAVARRSYGDALVAAGQLDEAGLQYERAVDLEPSLPALKGLANVYLKKKRRNLAEPVLRRTIAAFPYDSASHFQLGQLLERAGRKVEAIREFEAGLSTDPRNTEARAAIRRLQEL